MSTRAEFIATWKTDYKLKESDYTDLLNSIWMKDDGVLIYTDTIENITYANLLTLVNANSLVINKTYRIINYQTKHIIAGHVRGPEINVPASWNSPAIEPLLVKAQTNNILYKEAYSESFPLDIIDYIINPVDYDQSVYGKIIRRTNIASNVSTPFDFRAYKFGRWETVNGSAVYNSITNTGFGYHNFLFTDLANSSNVVVNGIAVPQGYTVAPANNIVFQKGITDSTILNGCSDINVIESVENLYCMSGIVNYSVSAIAPYSILQFNNNSNSIMRLISEVQYNTLTISGSNADGMHAHYTYQNQINTHKGDNTNPHQTTKNQVGLGNVDNTSDANKPISNATGQSINGVQQSINQHTNDNGNPHQVTKSQVGLGVCDNTADLDKPMSNSTRLEFNALTTSTASADSSMLTLINTKAPMDTPSFIGNISVTGSVYTKDGTQSFPSHSFLNQKKTGMFYNSTGQPYLALSVSGNNILTIRNDKVVSMNTSSLALVPVSINSGSLLYLESINVTGGVTYPVITSSPLGDISMLPALGRSVFVYQPLYVTPIRIDSGSSIILQSITVSGVASSSILSSTVSGDINIIPSSLCTTIYGDTSLTGSLNIIKNISASSASFGDLVNKSTFEADGTIRFDGNATVWKDIDFPIIIRTTGTNIPVISAIPNMGNLTMARWQVNDFNVCEIKEFSHEWKEETPVHWHLHLITSAATTGDSTNRYLNFSVEWMWANYGSVMTTQTVSSGDILIPANTPINTHMIVPLHTWTPTGGRIAAHVKPRLKRITSVGTAPSADPFCEMLQLHIEVDTVGSRQMTTKN